MQDLRVLSQIFTPTMFQKIVRSEDDRLFRKYIVRHIDIIPNSSNLDIIKSLYKALQKGYRCEYIYKNNLFLDIIRRYRLKDTLIFNEFKIATSKADLLLLNGSVRVFEIKTELDDFTKLSKQINDYQKFADKVFVVTDEKSAERLNLLYSDTNIGIIVFNTRNKLDTIKEASSDTSLFDFDAIFKILRKQEYLDLVEMNFGSIPDVPNTQIFRVCYELLASKDIVEFQRQVLQKLKERKILRPKLLKSSKTPKELKFICNSLNFNEQEYDSLYNFLKQKNQCINHM